MIIRLQGVVLPSMEAYLQRHLKQAEQIGADLVILEIDSPGGMVEPSFNIASAMLELQWAHTVAYVPEEALSGAAIISLGCDDIVMGPLATFGDAGPIVLGEDRMFRHAPEKYRTHLARRVRDLASATGRPPSLAEAMVDKDLVVYSVTNQKTGEITYMSQHELDSAPDAGDWQKGLPVLETREGSFLEVNGQRAVELQLANRTVDSRAELEEIYRAAQPLELLEDTAVDLTVQFLNCAADHRLDSGHRRDCVVPGVERAGDHGRWPDRWTLLYAVLLEPLSGRHGRLAGGDTGPGRGRIPGRRAVCDPGVRCSGHHWPGADGGGGCDGQPAPCDPAEPARDGSVG